jgi:hypothetical protein
MEIEYVIWNNFCNYNFLKFSTDFELFQRLQVKAGLTRFVLILAPGSTHCNSIRAPLWVRSSPW